MSTHKKSYFFTAILLILVFTFYLTGTAFSKTGPTKEQIYKISGDFSKLAYDGNTSDIFNTLKAEGWQLLQCDAFEKSSSEIKNDESEPLIIITGHSLGAAIAVLETAYFIEKKSFPKTTMHLVTLAEPCPGKENFNNRYKKQIKHYKWFCNLFDPVPLLPMVAGYKHFDYLSGQVLFNSGQPPVPPVKNIFGRHSIVHYLNYINNRQQQTNNI